MIHHRCVLVLQRVVAACAVADGPGAPFVEGILRALRASCRRPHSVTLLHVRVSFVDSRSSERFFFPQYFVHFVLGWSAQQRSMAIAVCSISSHVASYLLCVQFACRAC